MSNKFEKLLDYLVNEEMDKANDLFHQIVVEKSREIYENLIAEEDDEEDDEDVEESYGEEDEESMFEIGGDASDDLVGDVGAEDDGLGAEDEFGGEDDEFGSDDDFGDEMGGEMGGEVGDEPATKNDITDLADALEELKAEFQALLSAEEEEGHDLDMPGEDEFGGEEEFGADDEEEFGADEDDEESSNDEESSDDEESADESFMREYRETIGKPYGSGKGISGKSEESGINKTSPVSTAKGRPTTNATAGNIAQDAKGADPKPGVGGVLKKGGEFVKSGTQNVGTTQAKGYSEKSTGHGAEKKGSGEQSVNDKPIIGK